MDDYKFYVPILKGKLGEFQALGDLTEDDQRNFRPLIEIPPIPWNFVEEAPSKYPEDYLAPFSAQIARSWRCGYPFYLDVLMDNEHQVFGDGRHCLEYLAEEFREKNLISIPVTGLDRSGPYQLAVKVNFGGNGFCLRIEPKDFERKNLSESINHLLEFLHTNYEAVDLMLDLGAIPPKQHHVYAMALRGMLISIPNYNDWRKVILAASAFPENLMEFERDVISHTERSDWLLWKGLVDSPGSISRLPCFGDYGISSPELPEIDPRIMQASASIRYTTDNSWLIVKGRGVRLSGFEQYRELARKLIALPEYSGPAFSWGDNFIEGCAAGREGTGNLTTWRKVGTNHHIKFVLHQIANLP